MNFYKLLFSCSVGISELRYAQDYMSKPISSLCSISVDGTSFSITHPCFKSAIPLEPMLNNYYFLSEKYPSAIFFTIWSSKLRKTKSTVRIFDFVTAIWEPVFKECCQLLDSIHSRDIKLKDVDHYFCHLGRNDLFDHLSNFYKAIELCHNKKLGSNPWIGVAVQQMKLYWSLCNQAKAARTVLDLKESLELTGDFSIVESVAKMVTDAMKETASLKDMNEEIGETKSFLEQFCTQERLECLQTFSKCLNLVRWIREETKGMLLLK